MTAAELPRQTVVQLFVIRTAMLLGVLAFGVVTWLQQRSAPAAQPALAQPLGYAFGAATVTVVGGLFALRARALAAPPATRKTLYIIGYALAEAVALLGGVIWFLAGERTFFLAGIVLMAASFRILPLRRD